MILNDYEVLKETKVIYEYINDLLDNCDYISSEDVKTRNKLKETMEILSNIYSNCYEMTASNKESYKELKTDLDCPHCNNNVVISDLINYAYLCENCDENMYLGEGDLNHEWYFDKIDNKLDLNKSFVLSVDYDKEAGNVFISNEEDNGSGAKYNCVNTNELLDAVNTYVSSYEIESYFINIWESREINHMLHIL